MNRADRRRREKVHSRTGQPFDTFAVHSLLDEGKTHHQAGRLQEAERLYRLVLSMAPGHPDALHFLGLLAYRAGRFDEAIDFIGQAINASPDHPLYHFNLGVVAQRAGRLAQAADAYRKAIALNPRYADAFTNLGNVRKEEGSLEDALAAYRQALDLNPTHPDNHNNLGVVLKDQGRLDEAVAAYRRALSLKPTHVEALNNLGLALMERDELNEAVSCFERALAAVPGHLKTTYNLGVALIWKGEHDRAVATLRLAAAAKHDHGRPVVERAIYRSRLKHDEEQVRHLLNQGRLTEAHRPYLEALGRLREGIDRSGSSTNRTAVDPSDLQPVAASFNRFLYLAPCDRIPGGALSSDLDVTDIEGRYCGSKPEVTFIDGLLRPDALDSLRRFCRESTIWKKDYENGYLGAFLGDGFATPLLLQIAEELRLKFPRIFRSHHLTQAWAFKQDSARRGLNIHADAAAVNVNFWITPDQANLNPDSGGLVVYDKEAPREWNFKEYNTDQKKPAIMEWLKQSGSQAIRIPYRANRAVVFNSDLFHETDDVSFKDDYLSRRINVTLLYGYRRNG